MFLRIALLVPLLHKLLLIEELDDLPLEPSRDELLLKIGEAAKETAISLLGDDNYDRYPRTGLVVPRTGWFKFLRNRRRRLWRIHGLRRPLWIGEDGEIYRRYSRQYYQKAVWRRAEIEKRQTTEGLIRVLTALYALTARSSSRT